MRKADITVDLVSRLVRTQFPEWAQLAVRPVDVDGWDNATSRLGETMSRP
jgi:aminoglycoside phosphotransferase (APT) family kinase protein